MQPLSYALYATFSGLLDANITIIHYKKMRICGSFVDNWVDFEQNYRKITQWYFQFVTKTVINLINLKLSKKIKFFSIFVLN